jgi:NADH:ubiquinone oxidoreductase subunit 2 (subunit N)
MAISGIPPFNGFFSKLIIIIAAIQAKYYVLAIIAVFISFVTLAMYLKVLRYTFFNKTDWDDKKISVREVPFPMCFSMIFLAVLCCIDTCGKCAGGISCIFNHYIRILI